MPIIPDSLKATADDFVTAYGEEESVELTNLEQANITTINYAKLDSALAKAFSMCNSKDAIACIAGKVIIRSNLRQFMLTIARYMLDAIRIRPDVEAAYKDVIRQLAEATSPAMCEQSVDSDILEPLGLLPDSLLSNAKMLIAHDVNSGFTLRPESRSFF